MNLAQALDAERRRISEDLHDHAGPNLAAVALHLRAIEVRLDATLPAAAAAESRQLLAQAQALLGATIAQIRDLSTELRPARLQYAGLVPALAELLQRYRARTGRAARLEDAAAGDAPAPRLAPALEWLAFRVAQEAVNNCAGTPWPAKSSSRCGTRTTPCCWTYATMAWASTRPRLPPRRRRAWGC